MTDRSYTFGDMIDRAVVNTLNDQNFMRFAEEKKK